MHAIQAQAVTIELPSATEINKYLIVGMKKSGNGDAVNVQNTELGADRQFLSDGSSVPNSQGQGGPNTKDVFQERWGLGGGSATSPPPPAAAVFQGIDWTGNVAVTSDTGKFSMSDIDLFADLGVHCANSNVSACKQSVSNTNYFPDQQTSSAGLVDNNVGIFNFNSGPLLNELTDWRSFINSQVAESMITSNIENQNSKDGAGPLFFDLNAKDTNNDGLAIIDIKIDNGNSDFLVNNSDWILQGTEETLAIFRIQGESNFNLSNSSILLGDGGIGTDGTTNTPNRLGAIFVKSDTQAEGANSSDQVFNFNNVILNGIGLWDLVTIGEGGTTELTINDGQGCAQFISSAVTFNDVRWNRCAGLASTQVPEPSSLVLMGVALAGFAFSRKARRANDFALMGTARGHAS